MATVRELRDRARDLDIQGRSTMRKAELLAAIEEALRTHSGSSSSALEQPVPRPPPADTGRPARRVHRHHGATPLLPPLPLPPLPAAYDLTHVAVLPRNPRVVVVVWAIEARHYPEGGARLQLCCGDRVVAEGPVDRLMGRWTFYGLEPDQALHAVVVSGDETIATSGVVLLPPSGPSRVHQPLMGRIPFDRPLATLPRDLRAAAGPAPIPGDAGASEVAWQHATSATSASDVVRATDESGTFTSESHHRLVSSFIHSEGA